MKTRESFDEWLAQQVLDMHAPGARPLPTRDEANAWIERMFEELLREDAERLPPGRDPRH